MRLIIATDNDLSVEYKISDGAAIICVDNDEDETIYEFDLNLDNKTEMDYLVDNVDNLDNFTLLLEIDEIGICDYLFQF